MRVVLITTTISVPAVLRRFRQIGPAVTFILAGDRKTPHQAVRALVAGLGNAVYFSDEDQEKLGYASSAIIGWNRIMRRNIALLEAIKLKPDVIVSIDDDNLPLSPDYFEAFVSVLSRPYSGVMAVSESQRFNVGELLDPPVFHRGFPFDGRHPRPRFHLRPVQDKRIGVAAGLWLGDPDIDAVERVTNRPTVLHASDLLQAGVIVDNTHFAPVNSQNTAFAIELAPLMMVWIGVGRYDDIWASYVAERVMMETGYHVHYGRPFVWQERNPQCQWGNLQDELFGMEWTPRFCRDLLEVRLGEGGVVEKLRRLYEHLKRSAYLPPEVHALGEAWCSDLERVL
jgi:hypothetical protein